MTNQLVPIEINNQRILTTQQLAAVYGASEQQVQQNFNNHKDNFVEGKHYYLLKGEELRDFKNHFDNITSIPLDRTRSKSSLQNS